MGRVFQQASCCVCKAATERLRLLRVCPQDNRVGENACMVTCQVAGQSFPAARNTFYLSKYIPERPSVNDLMFEGDVLRYGQKVHIHMGPAYAGEEKWSLFSKIVCPTHFAKHSHHQLVGMTTRANYETVWQVRSPHICHNSYSCSSGLPCQTQGSRGPSCRDLQQHALLSMDAEQYIYMCLPLSDAVRL